jgi:hypothetical protein
MQGNDKVMQECPVCGRVYFANYFFKTIKYNGKDLLVCPYCRKKSQLEIQKQISEQEKKKMIYSIKRSNKNVRWGWMGLLIVSLVIISPIYNILLNIINWNTASTYDLFNLIPTFYFAFIFYLLLIILVIIYGIYAGLSLYFLKYRAVEKTKGFLIIYLVLGIMLPISQYITFRDYGIYTPFNVVRAIIATCIPFVIWYWFMASSKTVKRIYFNTE